ncbi:hypothetical protein L873DRAFT_1347336 [Choiromyces venosus 120613-1]|uniref:Uncharacterized protein n=1 Tax=Choiromyces venosus 120613-1 TaxID=1336337 RepID=A0A3N4K1D3_9PEZI|nr:hypothetical protein L873DRAFT_1347336 [Choiromyces venosus 120613-1]
MDRVNLLCRGGENFGAFRGILGGGGVCGGEGVVTELHSVFVLLFLFLFYFILLV